jgi:hypothetical protein
MIEMAAAKPAGASKTPLTVEDIQAAERAKILAHSLSIQRHREAVEAAAARPVSDEAARVLRAFDRVEGRKDRTPDDHLSAEAAGRFQETAARNVAAGYSEWETALDGHGRARVREIQAAKRREVT